MEPYLTLISSVLLLVVMALLALRGITDFEKSQKKSKNLKKVKGVDKKISKLETDLEKFFSDKSKVVTKLPAKDLKKLQDEANKLDDKTLSVGQFEALSKIMGKLSGIKKQIEKHK